MNDRYETQFVLFDIDSANRSSEI